MLETVATSRININLFVHSLNISVFWNSDGPETTDCRGSNHVMDLPAQDRLLNCLVRFCFARKKTSFSFLVAAKKNLREDNIYFEQRSTQRFKLQNLRFFSLARVYELNCAILFKKQKKLLH